MDERSGTVRLVDPDAELATRGLVATVSRTEVEEALRTKEPVDLLLDVDRVAADGQGRETERVALSWEPEDLERLLASTAGDHVSLTFDEGELRRLLDEDVEAHGARKTLAAITVAAGMAAAGAGSAFAMPADTGGPAGSSQGTVATAPADRGATASEISTGLGGQEQATAATGRSATASEISTGIVGQTPATPSEISTGIVQEPQRPPAEITTGITAEPTSTPVSADKPAWDPNVTEGLVAAGMILALTAAGFYVRSQRGMRPAT